MIENSKKGAAVYSRLNNAPTRDTVKIGLIYVEHGQDTQQQLFHNSAGSSHYNEFVGSLAWTVTLKEHIGYVGGLSAVDGTTAPYYATPTMEVIFHDITRMPTKESDEQQIAKKKHVGNDWVHIIWSEHDRDYKTDVITSQFNAAHVIVYPLPNGLYRVEVSQKDTTVIIFI